MTHIRPSHGTGPCAGYTSANDTIGLVSRQSRPQFGNPKPKPFYIPFAGYRHMYRSLIRFCGMDGSDASALLYPLYIGNVDSCVYTGVPLTELELSRDGFCSLTEPYARPYHTELQMYRSMIGLLRNIRKEATIEETRAAVRQFNRLIAALQDRFEAVYECEITDPKTRYNECWGRLTVRRSEPLTIFRSEYN